MHICIEKLIIVAIVVYGQFTLYLHRDAPCMRSMQYTVLSLHYVRWYPRECTFHFRQRNTTTRSYGSFRHVLGRTSKLFRLLTIQWVQTSAHSKTCLAATCDDSNQRLCKCDISSQVRPEVKACRVMYELGAWKSRALSLSLSRKPRASWLEALHPLDLMCILNTFIVWLEKLGCKPSLCRKREAVLL